MTAERVYLPHIWIQSLAGERGIGPNVKVWAGEIINRDGVAVGQYTPGVFHPVVQVRFAALTKPGFDELTALLQDDIKTLSGAA